MPHTPRLMTSVRTKIVSRLYESQNKKFEPFSTENIKTP